MMLLVRLVIGGLVVGVAVQSFVPRSLLAVEHPTIFLLMAGVWLCL